MLEPSLEKDSFDADTEAVVPECLAGLTFVFTGILDNLARTDAVDLVKVLGGRVTGAVSSKTSYLIVGEILDDNRPYYEGSKYRKAAGELKDKVKIVMGEKKLFGLCKIYQDKAMKEKGMEPGATAPTEKPVAKPTPPPPAKSAPATSSNPYAKQESPGKSAAPANPYAKPVVANPYAKKTSTNPYAKAAPANPYAKASTGSSTAPAAAAAASSSGPESDVNGLWVDRHKPANTREILGNGTNVKKLQIWLKDWEKVFVNNPRNPHGKSYSNPKEPWKAALLSGPPGIGSEWKTSLRSVFAPCS